jgi:hypothetical protein
VAVWERSPQDRYGRYLLAKRATILHTSLCGLETQHLAPSPPTDKAALTPAPAAVVAGALSDLERYQAQYALSSPRTRRLMRKGG